MNFDDWDFGLPDRVTLVKADGSGTFPDIKCQVDKNKIIVLWKTGMPRLDSGDTLIRSSSDGATTPYTVIDPCFSEGSKSGGIPACYNAIVEKQGLPRASRPGGGNQTYIFHGDNARINQNSVDNSTNTVNKNTEIAELIKELRQAIDAAGLLGEKRDEVIGAVDSVEAGLKAASPNYPFLRAMLRTLPEIGSVASLATTIISLFPKG